MGRKEEDMDENSPLSPSLDRAGLVVGRWVGVGGCPYLVSRKFGLFGLLSFTARVLLTQMLPMEVTQPNLVPGVNIMLI